MNTTLKTTLALALMTLLLSMAVPAAASQLQQQVALQEVAPTPTPDDGTKDDDWFDIDTDMCRLLGSCIDD